MATKLKTDITQSPFMRIQALTGQAARRGAHAEYGPLSQVEIFLAELKHRIETTEVLLTGEGLEILTDIRRSIFGDSIQRKPSEAVA
jgi:hypothetical protein